MRDAANVVSPPVKATGGRADSAASGPPSNVHRVDSSGEGPDRFSIPLLIALVTVLSSLFLVPWLGAVGGLLGAATLSLVAVGAFAPMLVGEDAGEGAGVRVQVGGRSGIRALLDGGGVAQASDAELDELLAAAGGEAMRRSDRAARGGSA